jgi:gliding motility-associated-like protein
MDGCPAMDSISIYVVSAPTIFSPDSQADNAVFKVFQLPPAVVADFKSLSIFDRWGNLVFETQNPEQSWNGDKFPSDVYLYYLTFDLKQEKKTVMLRGDLTLIR